jgi:hypothetical protein
MSEEHRRETAAEQPVENTSLKLGEAQSAQGWCVTASGSAAVIDPVQAQKGGRLQSSRWKTPA